VLERRRPRSLLGVILPQSCGDFYGEVNAVLHVLVGSWMYLCQRKCHSCLSWWQILECRLRWLPSPQSSSVSGSYERQSVQSRSGRCLQGVVVSLLSSVSGSVPRNQGAASGGWQYADSICELRCESYIDRCRHLGEGRYWHF